MKNHKIKVLFVSHDGNMAGAQQTLLTFLQNINRDQFEPYVIVPLKGGMLSKKIEQLNIPVYERRIKHWAPCIGNTSLLKKLYLFLKVLKNFRARSKDIVEIIELKEIDIVYTNTVTCIEGAIAARLSKTPHLWHIHEPVMNNSEITPLLPLWLYSLIINNLSNNIVFCSNILASEYPTITENSSVVYNGLLIPEKKDRDDSRLALLKHFNIGAKKKIVAIVGVLQPRKDHVTFLESAKRILKEDDNVAFLIIGKGSEQHTSHIQNVINSLELSKSVQLVGWWPDEIHRLLAGVDVLVISSQQESFGLTLIEALAMETPVVSTRCGGPEEIIKDGITSLLVPKKDPQSLAIAVMSLLTQPEKARQIGQAGRQDIIKRFNLNQYITGLEQTLIKLIE